jgi:hypothetical protein
LASIFTSILVRSGEAFVEQTYKLVKQHKESPGYRGTFIYP